MTRICITGGPRTGKTTLAEQLRNGIGSLSRGEGSLAGVPIQHTDDLQHLGWSEASAAAADWLDAPGPWIIEGVAVSRALRKWRDQHPDAPPPCDRVIYLSESYEALTPGQRTMAKGVATVQDEIDDWLAEHGVITEYPCR